MTNQRFFVLLKKDIQKSYDFDSTFVLDKLVRNVPDRIRDVKA